MKFVIYALVGFIIGGIAEGLADMIFPEDDQAQTILKCIIWAASIATIAGGILAGVTL